MRALILVAGAALAVSACSSNESADNTMMNEDSMNADIVANDPMADMNMGMDANMTMNGTDANMTMNAGDANMSMNGADANMTNMSNTTTNNAM
jgi:hypothetical protein